MSTLQVIRSALFPCSTTAEIQIVQARTAYASMYRYFKVILSYRVKNSNVANYTSHLLVHNSTS